MTDRTDEEIIEQIKVLIEDNVKPAVASHGGVIDFVDLTCCGGMDFGLSATPLRLIVVLA